jgi:imidazoleglycerol-phosphate dehydratase
MENEIASRIAAIKRTTKETDIEITLNLDGSGKAETETGIGFFDHMLDGFARHGLFDLKVKVKGDLNVDGHHTVEDTGIVLGKVIAEALGDKKGIKRYGSMILPMDETLVLSAVDLCGRPYFVMDAEFDAPMVGDFDTQLVKEFFYAVSYSAAMNLHIKVLNGSNDHHKIEAIFKAFAKALDEASMIDPRIEGVLSTKGAL